MKVPYFFFIASQCEGGSWAASGRGEWLVRWGCPVVSVRSNLQCLQSPCVTNINNYHSHIEEMLSSSDTWQHLSTSWTSSYYFTSSATSPSSRANPSCWLAEMPTLTPSDTFGLGCREWERAWGISCQGVWHMRNWFDCYKLPLLIRMVGGRGHARPVFIQYPVRPHYSGPPPASHYSPYPPEVVDFNAYHTGNIEAAQVVS